MQRDDQKDQDNFYRADRGLTEPQSVEIPTIELPEGGGAIRGIDEKLNVNAVNGTASFSIPLPEAPARGVVPGLTLSYSSGGGNSLFGLGWNVSLPSIKRKTSLQLPRYEDANESDTYLFASTEDLVSEFDTDQGGSLIQHPDGSYVIKERDSDDNQYRIRYYRPRIEGLFARIERWMHKTTLVIRWRVISKDNVTTLFGWNEATRLSDPTDDHKVFEWLPEFVFDDLGNCAQYVYKAEDDEGFDDTRPHNANRRRNSNLSYTNLYLTDIYYGNRGVYPGFDTPFPETSSYMFQTAFDYGEYQADSPYEKTGTWDQRSDAFAYYKPGFEIRTNRLCRRVLQLHHFDELPNGSALIRSLDFNYDNNGSEGFTFLKAIISRGYIKQPGGDYTSMPLPPIEFDYQTHAWNQSVQHVAPDDVVNAPAGTADNYQLTDLFSEGLSGILAEQAGNWYYKRNLTSGHFERAKPVAVQPTVHVGTSEWTLVDLDADGSKQLANYRPHVGGYFELGVAPSEPGFFSFRRNANVDIRSPYTRLIDLTGDGKSDILITEDHALTWYESKGREGFDAPRKTPRGFDEEAGPAVVFADSKETIFIADMVGDGLSDIVRIRASSVCYWPNLGYGRFGAKVAMDNPPMFDGPDVFHPAYLRLADISGSGTTDIVYLGKNKASCWLNMSGNGFSDTPFEITTLPEIHNLAHTSVADLLGTGTMCLVWSSPLSKDTQAPLRYIDLMSSKKPHLMTAYRNNLGKEVSLEYTPSTTFYIEDEQAGRAWATKLHFPIQCISRVETKDLVTGHRFVSSYRYSHGYYDRAEHEFRGFGLMEQKDGEHFEHWVKGGSSNVVDEPLHQDPVITRQWFHTGAFLEGDKILGQFENDYWYSEMARQGFSVTHNEHFLPDARLIASPALDPTLIDSLSAIEQRQAVRACKGMALRSELFAHDAPAVGATFAQIEAELTPYAVTSGNCVIELLQPKGQNAFAVFAVRESEGLSYNYERNIADPLVAHTLNLSFDEYGNPLESASIAYSRQVNDPSLPPETQLVQARTSVIYKIMGFTNDVDSDDAHRAPLPAEERHYEIRGLAASSDYYELEDFAGIALATDVAYELKHNNPFPGSPERRLIEHLRTIYYNADLSGPLPLGQVATRVFPFETYQLAYTPSLLADVFGPKVNPLLMADGAYVHSEGDSNWWIRSGQTQYLEAGDTLTDAVNRFFAPVSYTEPFGAVTKVTYFSAFTFLASTEDALGNRMSVEAFDFRTLMAARLRDPNDNLSETITDELGRVKAMAIMGKGAEADDLVGQQPTTAAAEVTAITQFLDAATSDQLITRGKNLLVRASMRFAYDYDAFMASGKPARTASILREEHFQDNNDSDIQIGFEYYGGLGEVVMKKGQAEPGVAKQVTVQPDNSITVSDIDTMQGLRWLGTGRKVINNKGNPVKKYQPYFSTTHQYEDQKELVESGVTPLIFYDAIGRETEMLLPDGTFTRKTYTAWERTFYDPGDTVMDSSWHDQRVNMLINAELAADGKDPLKEAAAATLSETYHDTPSIVYLDPMGRPVLQRGHNIVNSVDVFKFERVEIDIEGSVLSTVDARGNVAAAYKYSMLGVNAYQYLLDSGQRWDLEDVAGKALRAWDERDHEFRHEYDVLGRPSQSRVLGGDGVQPLNHVYERIFYGEAEAAAEANNLKGKVVRFYDTAGLSAVDEYDIKGEPLVNRRRLFADYKSVPNWTDANLAVTLEAEEYASSTVRDALGRSTEIVGPDGAVEQITYNEAGLLQSKQFQHVAGPLETIVVNIDYNEKGQRLRIERGNGVTTRYAYDKQNFNIIRVVSETAGNQVVQDLRYTYDAVGNVTHIDDAAVPLQFFNNQVITGVSTFSYDAFYQLTQATGRENNVVFSFGSRDNWNDQLYAHALNNGDPAATRNYTQSYSYDLAGNLLEMGHQAANNNWARGYTYNANSNRLVATSAGAQNFNYGYHSTHGFITSMPHLQDIGWNFKEKLIRSVRQKVLSGTPETTYYQYSADGERIRKITELAAAAGQSPLRKEERIYVGNYERYLKHSGANTGLVRHSHSIVDEEGRVALLEVRNNVDDGTNPRLTRYQLSNHLGSVSLELDQNAQTISYEEYHPFGTSAYRVSNAAIKAAAKRYRYLGLERDEETGLSYHSARYYITWLGRWLSTDPSGQNEGLNLYWYARNNPSSLRDVNGNESDEQKASGILQDFLIEQDVNYRKEVKFKVEVDGNWVEGRADFFIETKDGWQPLEMKGKANSKWTEAQKKYLPALKKGAKWETTGTSKFPKKVSGSGSAGVLNVHTVAAGKQQFRRLYESTIIKRPQGDPSKGEKITITRDSNGDIVDRTVEPDKVGRERAKAKGKKPKVKAPKGKAPRVKAKGPWGLIIGAVVGVTILVTTGDAYAAVQSVNPAAETTDAVVEGGDAGDVGGGVAKDIFYWTPPGWIYGTGELLWDANQAAMDASHFPVPEGFTEQMVKEGRNPFCAVCHDPRGPGSEAYRQQQLMESTFQGMPSMLDNADTQRAIVDWIESAQ